MDEQLIDLIVPLVSGGEGVVLSEEPALGTSAYL